MEFVSQNLLLISIAFISGAALLIPMLRDAQSHASQVTPSQAVMLLNRQHAVMIDVRESAELESGLIENSKHIPLSELGKRLGEIEKFKSKPVILICETGARSGKALNELRKAGFTQAFNLGGGLKAWKDAGQTLVKSKAK